MPTDVAQALGELRAEVRRLGERLVALGQKLDQGRLPHVLPALLTRKQAAKELSIGLTKLKGWIASGYILEAESGGIPASEVYRVAQPVQPKRHTGGRRRGSLLYDPKAEAAKSRALRRAKSANAYDPKAEAAKLRSSLRAKDANARGKLTEDT